MGRPLCGVRQPLQADPLMLAPDEGCVERNEDVLDRLALEDASTYAAGYEAYLTEVSTAAAAEARRGNEHLKTAVEDIAAMSEALAGDDLGGFSSAGARTLAALEEVESALDDGQALAGQENMGWSTELQDARDDLRTLDSELDEVDVELIADVDDRLGLKLADKVEGSTSERVSSVQIVTEVHLAQGLELRDLADLLADIDPADARPLARALAEDFGLHTETGTQAFYNGFMEDSLAPQDLKGWFARDLNIDVADTTSYGEYDEEAETCGLNDAGALRSLEEAREARAAEAREAMLELGVVRDPVKGGFAGVVGRVADLLATDDGDKANLDIKLKLAIPLPSGIEATIALNLGAGVARSGDQREVSCGFEFLLGAQLDAVIVKAFVEAGVVGKLRTSGDSFEEAFKLVILALYDRLHRTAPDLADGIFCDERMDEVSQDMDEDDFVQYALGLKVAAGIEIDQGSDPEDKGGLKGEGGAMWGTRLTGGAGERQGLDVRRDAVSSAFAKVSGKAGRFGVGAGVEASWVNGEFAGIKADAEGKAKLPADQAADQLFAPEVVGGMVGAVSGAIHQGAAAFDKDEPQYNQMISVAKHVGRASGGSAKLKAAAHDKLQDAGVGGIDVTYKIGLALSAGPGLAPKLTLTLSQATTMKTGSDDTPIEFEIAASMAHEIAKVELLA